jgi:hypothetical protein
VNAEGHVDENDNVSSRTVLRSQRPQNTPRNFMHENRETSGTPASQPGKRTAGEGQGRTARVHVPEESHSGIVPMNHSNKDGKPLAESEEGRPLIKENARQPNSYPTQSGKCVSQGLAGVRKAAKEMKFSITNGRARLPALSPADDDQDFGVHRLAPPSDDCSAARKLLFVEEKSCPPFSGLT